MPTSKGVAHFFKLTEHFPLLLFFHFIDYKFTSSMRWHIRILGLNAVGLVCALACSSS
jgi:hypothetical protein